MLKRSRTEPELGLRIKRKTDLELRSSSGCWFLSKRSKTEPELGLRIKRKTDRELRLMK